MRAFAPGIMLACPPRDPLDITTSDLDQPEGDGFFATHDMDDMLRLAIDHMTSFR
jgi:hypothetical protein